MKSQALNVPLFAAVIAGLFGSMPAGAQVSTCHTTNCVVGSPGSPVVPAECMTRIGAHPIAAPRVFEVQMDSSAANCLVPVNAFKPSLIRIEGKNTIAPAVSPWDYQCIEWHRTGNCPAPPWHSATEITIANTCVTATTCAATTLNATPSPCAFETGNINASTPNPILEYGSCHYRDVPAAIYPFECRLHAATGMTGMLTVVPSIKLDVTKGTGNNTVLAWPVPSGSAAGPWDVYRHTNPAMPKDAGLIRLTPAAGQATTRTFTDTACTPAPGQLCAYMVRECNQIGGICVN